MSDSEWGRVYEIEVTYHDSGFSLGIDMEEWRERIEQDFSSFDAIKEFHRTDFDDLEQNIAEHAREIPEDESPGPGIVITNAPKGWKENPEEAAPYVRALELQVVDIALYSLIEEEIEAQNELLEAGLFKPLIIRQSGFFEEYLELQSQLEFQRQQGRSLSNKEMDVIEEMGHTDRIRLAHLLGLIDEGVHGHLQAMASRRNELAHSSWIGFDADDEDTVETTAKKVLEILEDETAQVYETIENDELGPADDGFDIGFGGLDPETQGLQLGILDVLESVGGSTSVARIVSILPYDADDVRQRCLRMDEIGYLELHDDGETVSISEKGEELLEEEYGD